MIEAKPLDPARRLEIETHFHEWHIDLNRVIEELLAAEKYWREAVRDADWLYSDDVGSECWFCGGMNSVRGTGKHGDDCIWALANQGATIDVVSNGSGFLIVLVVGIVCLAGFFYVFTRSF